MRRSVIAAALAVPLAAVGLYELNARGNRAQQAASLSAELAKDLDLASAAGVEYAPALQTVSAVERTQKGRSVATAAPRRPRPNAQPAPRPVAAADEPALATAPDPEETQIVQVANGTAAEPEPTPEPAPATAPRPMPIPVGYPGRDGSGGGGWGGTGRGGRGGGMGGVIGVVIRGGGVGDDHCEIHMPRSGSRDGGRRVPPPVIVDRRTGAGLPAPTTPGTGGVGRRGAFLR